MQLYKDALEAGTVTEKERQLWEYVLSAYGTEEFTTKRLEKILEMPLILQSGPL